MLTNLFSHILTVNVSMTAVIAAAFVLMRLFGRNFAARTRYLVWTILILRLCIPFGTLMISPLFTLEVAPLEVQTEEILPVPPVPEEVETERVSAAETLVRSEIYGDVWVPVQDPSPAWTPETEMPQMEETGVVSPEPVLITEPEEPVSSVDFPELWNSRILPGICLLWLTVAAGSFFGQLIGYLRLMRSMRRTMLVPDPEAKTLYGELCREMGLRHPPKLTVSALAGSPMVCGFFRSRVVLPDMSLDPHALRGILTHELIHWRRGDVWRKLAALFARSLHWYNPLVHLVSSRFMRDMEMACDEAVLAGLDTEERRVYGMVMLDIVKRCHLRSGQLTTRFNPRKGAVMERFRNIMDTEAKKRGWWIIGVASVLCLGAGMFVACEVKPAETVHESAETEAEPAETEEIPVVEETEEVPDVEVVQEEMDAEPAVETVDAEKDQAQFVPVEVDRTKYALPAEKNAVVYTGYRVDYNAQMHMDENYSAWYIMELPQITGEEEWNRMIADRYFHQYGDVIVQNETDAPDIHRFYAISYHVVLWDNIYTIVIRHHGGYNGSDAVFMQYDIHHYDSDTGEFLTTDQFLAVYTDGEWDMNRLMILANGYGFSRDETGEIWEIPEENFQGVIPSVHGNGLFDLCFQGVSYAGAFASRVMVADYVPYVTASCEWTDLGGGTHTTEAGREYFWLVTNVDAGYRLSVNYPLAEPEEWRSRGTAVLNTTLASDSSVPEITFSEEYGEVYLHLTGETLDGEVQDQVFLCRQPETKGDWFTGYLRGWIGETEFFSDPWGWIRDNMENGLKLILEAYAAGRDVTRHIADQDDDSEIEYPNMPVRSAPDREEIGEVILPTRKAVDWNTWQFSMDLGSGYAMEFLWGVGGMGDIDTGYIESIRITTGEDPITAWRPHKGDGLLFAEEFGDTGEWLLSYTSVEGQPVLYKAYYTESGKLVHEPQVLGGTRFDNGRAIGARYTEDGKMLVLLEIMDGKEDVAYATFSIDLTEKKTVIGAADLLEWWMNGVPIRFPNQNMPNSGDTVSEIAVIPVIVDGGNGTEINPNPARYITALLTGDAETLAELSAGEAEMYQNVRLHTEKYTVWLDEKDPGRLHFLFLSEKSHSVLEGMQVGWNHYIVEEGMFSTVFMPVDIPAKHYSGAAAAVAGLLNSSLLYEFPKNNDMDRDQRAYVTEFILSRLWNEQGSTAEEIAAYAKIYLGIPDFTPSDSCAVSLYDPEAVKDGEPERYIIPAHGGWSVRHRITGVTENSDGTVDVKVQFYADYNKLVPSHRYTYTMREIDGEWAFEKCEMTRSGRWEPKKIAI